METETLLLSMNETELCPYCDEIDNEPSLDNSSFPGGNATADGTNWSSITGMVVFSILAALIILITIVGNALVIAAVFMERNLRNVANRLIVSLAFADLMVACFVMGPAAHYMISGAWHFGAIGCDLWTSIDVLSSSILHLLAVALDRYWAVSKINWTVNRRPAHINLMILLVWTVAALVSVAPLLGWKDPHFLDRIEEQRCMVSPDLLYQLFATMSTFYIPTILILVLYWKIWKTAKSRIRHRVGKGNDRKLPTSTSAATIEPANKIPMSSTFSADELSCHTATVETSQSTESVGSPVGVDGQELEQIQPPVVIEDDESGINPSVGPGDHHLTLKPPPSPFRASQASLSSPEAEPRSSNAVENSSKRSKEPKPKETLEAKRERKAAKTLGIITGAFMVCWLPFFLFVLIGALCSESCLLPDWIGSIIQWLGYINSTLNPCIYTVFNPEFRLAFKKILFGRGSKNSRRR